MKDDVDSAEVRLGKAKQALSLVVNDLENLERRLEPLNDFGKAFAVLDAMTSDGINPGIESFSNRLRTIAKNTVFMRRVLGAKVRWIAVGAGTSLDGENLLVLAYCTRALFEHYAAVVWLVEKMREFSRSLENKSNPNLIENAFQRCEGSLQSAYYNKDGTPNFVHISGMLKSLSHRIPDQKEIYAKLCDYLHPNYGSNFLVSSGEIGAGIINPSVFWRIDEAMYLTSIAIRSINAFSDTIGELDQQVVHFVGLVDLASKPGVSISNWFSVRAAKHHGDGKSKETALWFPKARTKIESIKMLYEFLNAEGRVVARKSFEGFDGEWVYDRLETDSGVLWFRSPSKF